MNGNSVKKGKPSAFAGTNIKIIPEVVSAAVFFGMPSFISSRWSLAFSYFDCHSLLLRWVFRRLLDTYDGKFSRSAVPQSKTAENNIYAFFASAVVAMTPIHSVGLHIAFNFPELR